MRRLTWIEAFGDLGDAVLDLVRAEIRVITDYWRRTAITYGWIAALAVLTIGLIVLFSPGLLLVVMIDGLSQWQGWAYWQAASAVFGLLILVCLILGAVAAFLFKTRSELPNETLRRRLDDHRGWWQGRMLGDGGSLEGRNETAD